MTAHPNTHREFSAVTRRNGLDPRLGPRSFTAERSGASRKPLGLESDAFRSAEPIMIWASARSADGPVLPCGDAALRGAATNRIGGAA